MKRHLLFWNVMQRRLVVGDRHFGVPNWYIMDCLTLEYRADNMSQNICNKHKMRNIIEERKASAITRRKTAIFKNEFILQ